MNEDPGQADQIVNMADWYTAKEATERLKANSGREIPTSYPRTLAKYGKVRTYDISERMHLYLKADIDNYIVEDRGEKSGRAKRQKAIAKKQTRRGPGRPLKERKPKSVAAA